MRTSSAIHSGHRLAKQVKKLRKPVLAAWVVNVFAQTAFLLRQFTNNEKAVVSAPAGPWNLAVTVAGSSAPVIGPAVVRLMENSAYLFFVVEAMIDAGVMLGLVMAPVTALIRRPEDLPRN